MIVCAFFYVLYSIAHVYLFLKLNFLFEFNLFGKIVLGAVFLFLVLSPVLIHFCNLKLPGSISKIYAHIGYTWVAFIVFVFPIVIAMDMYNLGVVSGGILLQRDLSRITLSPPSTLFIPLLLSIIFCIYGYFEAQNLRLEHVTVETSKLPAGVEKLRIAQISDLHLGIIVREKMLKRVSKKIEAIKPDVIVSTGDLLDGEVNHIDHLAGRLKSIKPRLGKFAVIGNHEFFGGLEHAVKFTEEAGFTLLRGRGVTIENLINIAGVDDIYNNRGKINGSDGSRPEHEILAGLPQKLFTLFLKHRADTNGKSIGLFDLQLSGHTHRGQIFPLTLATTFLFHHHSGYIDLQKGASLYVSRGVGTAGPPIRLFSPPEIAVIDVVKKA
jgi:predicted MPP superfamily phosphohydrolase